MFASSLKRCDRILKRSAFLPYFNQGILCQNIQKKRVKRLNGFPSFNTKTPDHNDMNTKNPAVDLETWVSNLTQEQRNVILSTLLQQDDKNRIIPPTIPASSSTPPLPLGTPQLLHVGLHYSLPFIGFGFLDNFIMIIAGDYIDLTVGSMLGISTMAAAGIGNAISDVAGVGSAQFVESISHKLGVPQPKLDPEQFTLKSTIWAINIGRAIGVAIGCLLGMIPLLFLPTSSDGNRNKKKTANEKDEINSTLCD